MTQNRTARGVALGEAFTDFGWFYSLFAMAVSAPSLLSLLQMVFVDHRLVDALQWIVDGYDRIVAAMASVIEPLLSPIVAWINEAFRVNYGLHSHWRPTFVLSMVFVMSFVRTGVRAHPDPFMRIVFAAVWAPLLTLVALGIALNVGLIPLYSGWHAQARIAGFPVATVAGLYALLGMTGFGTDQSDAKSEFAQDMRRLLVGLSFGVLAAAVAAALSLHPLFARGAGVITLALFVCILGLFFLVDGLTRLHAEDAQAKVRLGLTMLGGFATAALIVIADFALRALGAA